jgi:hypothetical protein
MRRLAGRFTVSSESSQEHIALPPVLADDKLYITSEDGLTTVVKAGPKFEVIAENALKRLLSEFSRHLRWTNIIRTAGQLFCIGTSARASQ